VLASVPGGQAGRRLAEEPVAGVLVVEPAGENRLTGPFQFLEQNARDLAELLQQRVLDPQRRDRSAHCQLLVRAVVPAARVQATVASAQSGNPLPAQTHNPAGPIPRPGLPRLPAGEWLRTGADGNAAVPTTSPPGRVASPRPRRRDGLLGGGR
jgi:hypothetical protein